MATRICVIGDGAMGTVAARRLALREDLSVTLWCQFDQNAEMLARERVNHAYLPGVTIPDQVLVTSDPSAISPSDALVLAVPMPYLSATLERLTPHWRPAHDRTPVVSVIKGIEQDTFRRPSEIIESHLAQVGVIALAGPLHAEELALGMPGSVVAASPHAALVQQIRGWFADDYLRVYSSSDLVGAELGGALKNVIAIAAGICDGAGFGDNAKSALMTRGLVEMIRLGAALGADRQTFYGMAGLGDLITTCFSRHGRNRAFGERVGAGEDPKVIMREPGKIVEGVWTSRSVESLAKKMSIAMPVSHEVYRILFEGQDIPRAVAELMNRPPTSEA